MTDETTNAKIRINYFMNGITVEDSAAICAFCGYPKHACTCSCTASIY